MSNNFFFLFRKSPRLWGKLKLYRTAGQSAWQYGGRELHAGYLRTHSGYVINTAFPRQQCLYECDSLSRYSYLACLDIHSVTASSWPEPPHYRGFDFTVTYTILGRSPLDEWSARYIDLYVTKHNSHKRQTSCPQQDVNPGSHTASGRRPTPPNERPQYEVSKGNKIYIKMDLSIFPYEDL